MKRGIILAVVAISMTGAASANLFTTSPQGAIRQAQAREATPVPAKVVVEARTNGAATTAVAPAQRTASLDVRQAPVPLLGRPRLPAKSLAGDATNASAKGETTARDDPSAAVPPSAEFSENAARSAIEADGYKGVRLVRKVANGGWQAKALRGKTEVLLMVDATGGVSTAD